MPSARQQRPIGRLECGLKSLPVHRASVDEDRYPTASRARHVGASDRPAHARSLAVQGPEWCQEIEQVLSVDLAERRRQVPGTGRLQDDPIFDVKRQADVRRGDREAAHDTAQSGGFTARYCRANVERRAGKSAKSPRTVTVVPRVRAAGSSRTARPPRSVSRQPLPISRRRNEIELCNCGDAWQRLPAETQGADVVQTRGGELTSRMSLARKPQIRGTNATTVVADSNEIETPAPNIDANAARSGVERVLDQLFDD